MMREIKGIACVVLLTLWVSVGDGGGVEERESDGAQCFQFVHPATDEYELMVASTHVSAHAIQEVRY